MTRSTGLPADMPRKYKIIIMACIFGPMAVWLPILMARAAEEMQKGGSPELALQENLVPSLVAGMISCVLGVLSTVILMARHRRARLDAGRHAPEQSSSRV